MATSGGLYQFLRDTEEFVKIHIDGVKFTSSLYPVGNNKLWITTDKGIKLLDCKTKLITDFISHEQSGMFVHKIFKDKSGILWSCSVKGIRCFRASDGKPVSVPQAIQDQLNKPLNRIFSIQEDADGDIWIGTETSGLFWYKRATGECINFKHSYNTLEEVV